MNIMCTCLSHNFPPMWKIIWMNEYEYELNAWVLCTQSYFYRFESRSRAMFLIGERGWWSTAGVGDLVRYLNCDREDLTHRPRASLLQSPGLSFLHGQWRSRTTPRLPHVVFDWVCSPASEHSCDLFPLFYLRFFFFHLTLVSSPEGSLLPVQRYLDVRSHLGLFVGRFIIESHMITQGSRFIQHKCTASNHLSEGLIDCTEKVTKVMHLLRYVMYLTVFQVHAMLFRPVWSSHRRAGTPSRYIWLGFTGVTWNAYILKNCDWRKSISPLNLNKYIFFKYRHNENKH